MNSVLTVFLICCSSFIGPGMGVDESELNFCPPTPNCVSSQSWKYNYLHKIREYEYSGSKEDAYEKLYKYLDDKENVSVREESDQDYIRVYYFTKILRFPDKVEFYFPKDTNKIQIRSASVFGIFDFFHNRVRLELIRSELGFD
ncbi:MAG: DUF1499 domain-containing protein [Leptospiraceae bacterium]|nr:DUF1499 domain-containing protein [Leptospiraceae bacterium]MCP5510932.1 DUF1499 domain-containing protein [Leptospiraceae bacterium]